MHAHHRLLAAALATLAFPATLAAASPAHAAELQPLDTTAKPGPLSGPVRDAVMPASSPKTRRAKEQLEQAEARGVGARMAQRNAQYAGRYRASDGTSIRVYVDGYVVTTPQDRQVAQNFVNFLGSRRHASELKDLRLILVTPRQMGQWCAATALACYFPSLQAMVIPGQDPPPDPNHPLPPPGYVITHELGHHVANNRRNDPWDAVHWGPKRWVTLHNVCLGVRAGRYFPSDQTPNDQGGHYEQNPGENWAEAYAQRHYQGQWPWQFERSLQPNPLTFQAVDADVVTPWRSTSRRRSGRLSGSRRSKSFPIATTLDGRISLRLRGPKKAQYNLELYANGQRLKRTRKRGSRDRLSYDACALRSFEARVVRRSGRGSFKLTVGSPG